MENQNDLRIKFLKIADDVKNDLIFSDTKAILIVGSLANSIIGRESDVDICVIKDGDFKHKPGPHFHRNGVAVAVDDIGLDYVLENDLLNNYLLANKLLNSIIIYDRDGDIAPFLQEKKNKYYSEEEIDRRFRKQWENGKKILEKALGENNLSSATIFLSFFRGFCPAAIYLSKKSPTTRRMYSRFLDAKGELNTRSLDNLLGLNGGILIFNSNCEILKVLSEKFTNILKVINYDVYKENENYLNMASVELFIAVGRELLNDFKAVNSANFCLKTYAAIIYELIINYGYINNQEFFSCINDLKKIFQDTTNSVKEFVDEMSRLEAILLHK